MPAIDQQAMQAVRAVVNKLDRFDRDKIAETAIATYLLYATPMKPTAWTTVSELRHLQNGRAGLYLLAPTQANEEFIIPLYQRWVSTS